MAKKTLTLTAKSRPAPMRVDRSFRTIASKGGKKNG